MPFVQRIIEPKYLSRSQKTTRICDDNFLVVRTSASPINNCREAEIVPVNNVKEICENGDSESKKDNQKNSKTSPAASSISNNSPSPASTEDKKTKTSDVKVNGSGITESGYYNNSSSLCVDAPSSSKPSSSTSSSTTSTTHHAFNAVNRNTKVITGFELESMCNITLSNCLRQLASLLVIANNMFSVLNGELQGITDRTTSIKKRIQQLEGNVYNFDPKLVSVRKYFCFHSLLYW